MTRDEAVKIAADAMRCQTDVEDWKLWTAFVVQGADALLAALGEPKDDDAHAPACCAATEARVVEEIVKWLRRSGLDDVPRWIERGDWRVKGPKR